MIKIGAGKWGHLSKWEAKIKRIFETKYCTKSPCTLPRQGQGVPILAEGRVSFNKNQLWSSRWQLKTFFLSISLRLKLWWTEDTKYSKESNTTRSQYYDHCRETCDYGTQSKNRKIWDQKSEQVQENEQIRGRKSRRKRWRKREAEKQVAKISGRSLQRHNLSAGRRSTLWQFNNWLCFPFSLSVFLKQTWILVLRS